LLLRHETRFLGCGPVGILQEPGIIETPLTQQLSYTLPCHIRTNHAY
jgi:hypothetical protein